MDRNDLYVLESPLVLSTISQLTRLERFDLKDKPFTPVTPTILRTFPDDEEQFSFFRHS